MGIGNIVLQEKSGVPLVAHEKFSEPREVEVTLPPFFSVCVCDPHKSLLISQLFFM